MNFNNWLYKFTWQILRKTLPKLSAALVECHTLVEAWEQCFSTYAEVGNQTHSKGSEMLRNPYHAYSPVWVSSNMHLLYYYSTTTNLLGSGPFTPAAAFQCNSSLVKPNPAVPSPLTQTQPTLGFHTVLNLRYIKVIYFMLYITGSSLDLICQPFLMLLYSPSAILSPCLRGIH